MSSTVSVIDRRQFGSAEQTENLAVLVTVRWSSFVLAQQVNMLI